LFERKYDGIRLLAHKHGKSVRLYSRNRLEQNLPRVAEAARWSEKAAATLFERRDESAAVSDAGDAAGQRTDDRGMAMSCGGPVRGRSSRQGRKRCTRAAVS
jgi:hypothetical protein